MADRAILIEDNEDPETPRRITRGHSPGSTASSADRQFARNKESAEHGTPRTDTLRPSSQYTLRRQKLHRIYEAAYAEYEKKHYVACKNTCMNLLCQSTLPQITRVSTLHLIAACSYYHEAKSSLETALKLCNEMADDELIPIIRKDTKDLLEEIELYRPKDGDPAQLIKEFESDAR